MSDLSLPVAFYAPLKSPDSPSPSGDRTVGRLLRRALAAAGFAPDLASRLRTYDRDGTGHAGLRDEALRIADGLATAWLARPAGDRPRLWFTYHVYYKAPDWIGPRVAAALGIPYAIAEGSRAGKRALGPHALGHAGAEAALDAADAVFSMTRRDRVALAAGRPSGQSLLDLPPFLDSAEWPEPPAKARPPLGAGPAGLGLLAVAMMRGGDKTASYRLLAEALGQVRTAGWRLDVVGDGPARAEIEALFEPLSPRVRFRGLVADRTTLAGLYAGADLLVWPAVNEAYGMALLEAQAQGCPVLAGAYGGVAEVVRDGVTGLLRPPGDAGALARAIDALGADRTRLSTLGASARRFVREERSLAGAAAILRAGLTPLLGARGSAP